MSHSKIMQVKKVLKEQFIDNYHRRRESIGDGQVWRWVATTNIAYKLGWSLGKTRYWLHKLRNQGVIDCKSFSGWLRWSLKNIEGFEPTKYEDYYKAI